MNMPVLPAPQYDELSLQLKNNLLHKASYLPAEELNTLEKACDFAFIAHQNQKPRDGGEPYITHPLSVAIHVACWGYDLPTLIAALLHDTLEDTPTTKDSIIQNFGETVLLLVEGVTDIKSDDKSYQINKDENFKRIVLSIQKDMRVLVIKLADRLHNMQTLDGVKEKIRRVRKAQETSEIYVRLADLVGMHKVYRQLQDLSFRYTHEDEFRRWSRLTQKWYHARQDLIESLRLKLQNHLESWGIRAQIAGELRTPCSLAQLVDKYNGDKAQWSQYLYSFKIVVPDVKDCYAALGAIHQLYTMYPRNKFRDHISIPKKNQYQALHTTVVIREKDESGGQKMSVRIFSEKMCTIAEEGVIKPWLGMPDAIIQQKSQELGVELLGEVSDDDNSGDISQNLKQDWSYEKNILVFTPHGKDISLPRGATPVDFAYSIHSQLGNHCAQAKVNERLVDLNYALQMGDRVEIIRSSQPQTRCEWLDFVKTSVAKREIRAFFRRHRNADILAQGTELLERTFEQLIPDELSYEFFTQFKHLTHEDRTHFENIYQRDCYQIGLQEISPVAVVRQYAQQFSERTGKAVCLKTLKIPDEVSGNDLICLSSCCHPVAGDPIRAVVQSHRVEVHRAQCKHLKSTSPNAMIDVHWEVLNRTDNGFNVQLIIVVDDNIGVMHTISGLFLQHRANITSIGTLSRKATDQVATLRLEVKVRDTDHLYAIIRDLEALDCVSSVHRQ